MSSGSKDGVAGLRREAYTKNAVHAIDESLPLGLERDLCRSYSQWQPSSCGCHEECLLQRDDQEAEGLSESKNMEVAPRAFINVLGVGKKTHLCGFHGWSGSLSSKESM